MLPCFETRMKKPLITGSGIRILLFIFTLTIRFLFHFQSRDKLLRALRAMNAGDAAEQAIRQVDKMIKNNERTSREVRFSRVITLSKHCPPQL